MRYLVAIIVVAASVAGPSAQIGSVSDKQLIAVIETYLEAFGKLDVAAMDRLETDDFVFVQDGLVLTKPQQMASLKAPGRKPGNLRFEISVKSEHMWVTGNSAVMTGTMTVTGTGGKPTKAAFTHLLRRTGADWQIQHSHYSTEQTPTPPAK